MNAPAPLFFYDIRNVACETTAHFIENICNLAIAYQSVTHVLMVGKSQLEPITNFFKRVTKGTMAQIVDKRCR